MHPSSSHLRRRWSRLRYAGQILGPLILVSCAPSPGSRWPLLSAEECLQRAEETRIANPPSGLARDSARDAAPDSAAARSREGQRAEVNDSLAVLDRPPQLLRMGVLQQLMKAHYPPALLARGIGGTTVLEFIVRTDSVTEAFRVLRSSGYSELDEASVRVIGNARFAPGRYKGCPVRVSTVMPVTWAIQEIGPERDEVGR